MWVQSGCRWSVACLPFGVSTWCRCAGSWGFRTCWRWLWSSGRVFPPFCPLFCFACGVLRLNVVLFRVFRGFLEGFGVFVWVCLSWCFAWLVWLLCACGVRRLYDLRRVCLPFVRFSFFCPCVCSPFMLFAYLLGLCLCYSLLVLFACFVCPCGLVCLCCFFFPFGLYAKKGAPCWCVLSCPVVGC